MDHSVMRTSDSSRHSRYKLLHIVMNTHVNNLQLQDDVEMKVEDPPMVFGLFQYWF